MLSIINKFSVVCLLLVCFAEVTAADPTSKPAPAIKNILFIVSDDLKASVLGCYGDGFCQTPNIDRLASTGVVFDRAYCQGTWCAPSRQSFMFSRYRGKAPTNLGQHFREHGWYSARVGKIYHMRVPGDIIAGTDGLDVPSSWTERFNSSGREAHTPGDYACLNLNIFTNELAGRQSTKMPHRMFVSVEYDGDGSDQPDHKSATKAIELLQQHGQKPFFLAVGLVRPHYPMVAPRPFFARHPWQKCPLPERRADDLEDIPELGIAKSTSANRGIDKYPDNQRRMWAAYYASVNFMDAQVGRILDELERLGLRDSTAVVFTSDHGYHLGEHDFWEKANLHEEVTRVPLIFSVPGVSPQRTDSIVELVDIFPTLTDLAGLEQPSSVQGTSLRPILVNRNAIVKSGAISFSNGTSWRTSNWAYMRYDDETEELYDMQNDPNQFHNLALDRSYQDQLDKLRQEFDEKLADLK
ncbi:MAG: sulfatase [Bythopirellula sp.]